MTMERDAFSQYHPAVNFVFFLGALGFGVLILHPAYLALGLLGAGCYALSLLGRKALGRMGALLPLLLLIAAINPIFNTGGSRTLFTLFGRPYTLEALCYGFAIAAIFGIMMLWFLCYSAVMTSDRFLALFGSRMPGLSLLLVMVLRLIPNLLRKSRQILAARAAIGKGTGQGASLREKLRAGAAVLSALTDWALEGSVITGDAMGARGHGTGRRTAFTPYRFTLRDGGMLLLFLALMATTVAFGHTGAVYTPALSFDRPTLGLVCYGIFLMIPTMLHIWEDIQWRVSLSKI